MSKAASFMAPDQAFAYIWWSHTGRLGPRPELFASEARFCRVYQALVPIELLKGSGAKVIPLEET
ncbi:hypothetical protein FHS26_003951 [Rhizobium pisi]|uniref:Uncharacterized protein n=1 Tax=Rhizobium pisi TaxID=574561 RepID=A0A4R0CNW6_9HYPH|nr:hypothetical protein [Rhizobium pisi]MBB3136203.1 hypothetical protein [Rhizobium pisi]TCA53198.1 hypothetical protein E0J16_18890 [Rhizobium pisi]